MAWLNEKIANSSLRVVHVTLPTGDVSRGTANLMGLPLDLNLVLRGQGMCADVTTDELRAFAKASNVPDVYLSSWSTCAGALDQMRTYGRDCSNSPISAVCPWTCNSCPTPRTLATTLNLQKMNLGIGAMLGDTGRIEFRNMRITNVRAAASAPPPL